jgi:hypothetical protein
MARLIPEFGETIDEPVFRCDRCNVIIEAPPEVWVWTLAGLTRIRHTDCQSKEEDEDPKP